MYLLLQLIFGFLVLIKGADLLVDGSSSIAKKFKISSIVIGLTIVAFGTSMPEFVVNIYASYNGNSEIAIGNILGSNIANILLILGISALINPIIAKKNTVIKEIPFSLLAALIVGFTANDILIDGGINSAITRIDGLILLSFLIIFLYYIFGITKSSEDIAEPHKIIMHSITKSTIYVFLGLAGLVVGGKFIVDSSVELAKIMGLSEALIGLTVVAVGTSLPELATSAVAAYKKQTDIAIGNVVGSNIFNIFWILGFSSVIRPLPFSQASNTDILMTISASLILFIAMFIGKRHVIERWQGGFMVSMYFLYLAFLFINH